MPFAVAATRLWRSRSAALIHNFVAGLENQFIHGAKTSSHQHPKV
jgi:hypothetical protein